MRRIHRPLLLKGRASPAAPAALDLFTANLWGAYGLDQLVSTATKALRVRRSSDNAELDIGFLGGVLNAAALLAFCGSDSGYVPVWYDQSGAGNDVLQATASKQPMIVDAGDYTGEVLFDGVDDKMESANSTAAGTGLSFYLAGRHRLGGNNALEVWYTHTGLAQSYSNYNTANPDCFSVVHSAIAAAQNGSLQTDQPPTRDGSTYANTFNLGVGTAGTALTQNAFYINGAAAAVDAYVASTGGVTPGTNFAAGTLVLGDDQGTLHYARCAMRAFLCYTTTHAAGTVASISSLVQPARALDGLDGYTTNLWGAYSLRRLLSSFSGSPIRVRRSSDNTEQDIGLAGGVVDSAALLAFCGAGSGYVTKLYDQSGNGRDFAQTTSSRQFRIVNAGVVDVAMMMSAAQGMTGPSSGTPTGITAFLRSRSSTGPAAVAEILCTSESYDAQGGFVMYRSTGGQLFAGVGTNGSSAYATVSYAMMTANQVVAMRGDRTQAAATDKPALLSGGRRLAYLNNFSNSTPSGAFTSQPWFLGGVLGATNNYFDTGEVDTLVIYNAALSDANIDRISRRIGG